MGPGVAGNKKPTTEAVGLGFDPMIRASAGVAQVPNAG